MRGKAVLRRLLVGLLSGSLAAPAAQIDVRSAIAGFLGQQPARPPAGATNQGDLLQFVDGSLMHGGLISMNPAFGLRWENPAAIHSIDLLPGHVDSIRFARAVSVTLAPTARLRFVNGDEVPGSITSLRDDHLSFSAWFGRSPAIPRASLQTITFLSSNYAVLYDGPADADGWVIGSRHAGSWFFRDGAFISELPGSLGRDFNLSGSSTIEFDLAWRESFALLVDFYCHAVDQLDPDDSCLLDLTRKEISLRRFDSSRQLPPRNFGSVPWPVPAARNKARITIQLNQEEGTVGVWVDHVPARRWKVQNDSAGGSSGPVFGGGGGLVFQQEGVGAGSQVRLSNLKISQWEGRYEPEPPGAMTNVDVIRFINHDHAAGKITGIDGGKVTLALGDTVLQIPLQRVTQINFAATPAAASARDPWEVRAHFPYGGSVSFQLQKWSDKEVVGQSPVFGPLAFQPGQIRQLDFNLGHAPAAAPAVSDQEFEGLNE
jgi:hypothetical protein